MKKPWATVNEIWDISEHEVCIYARVSSSGQDLRTQISTCRQVAKAHGVQQEEIQIVTDDSISARKIKLENRMGITEILRQVRIGRIKVLIVYDRDRLARNTAEYLSIVRELMANKVKIVFASLAANDFTADFGIEAFLALTDQMDGNRIEQRTADARKFYPNSLFGYVREGKGSKTKYEFSDEVGTLKAVFAEFETISTLDEYLSFQKKWKSRVRGDLKKVLTNGFYAGYIIQPNDYHIELRHIEPLFTLQQILENIQKLKGWGMNAPKPYSYLEKQNIQIQCGVCKKEISLKFFGGEYAYSCKHSKVSTKAPALFYQLSEIEEAVTSAVKELIHALDTDLLVKKAVEQIDKVKRELLKDKIAINRHLKTIEDKIISSLNNPVVVTEQLRDLAGKGEKIRSIEDDIQRVTDLKVKIYKFVDQIKDALQREVEFQGLNILVYSINLNPDSLEVVHRFKDFLKQEVINEK